MKTKNLIERLSLFLLALVLTMPTWAQGGNGTEVVSIGSKAEWKAFCQRVNNNGEPFLNAKLTRDVDLGEEIVQVGSVSYPYSGTFDGNGHTLKFNWNAGKDNQIAPFWYVKDATIKNLRTQGKITSKGYGLSGMVYIALGTTTITGCISDVDITGGDGGWDDSRAAGMVQAVASGASVQITDCLVKGSITDNADEDDRTMAGFVLSNNGTYTLTRCLYVGTNNATNNGLCYTFGTEKGISATFTDCYYLNTCGKVQGDKITEAQLKNGYVAYKLQKGRESQVWGQTLGTDNEPQLTADAKKRVYQVKFTYNGEVKAMRYANSGKTVALPTAEELLGAGYNPKMTYTLNFGNFTATTPVTEDKSVDVTVTGTFPIATAADWKEFCALVNGGQTTLNAKMTADVNLGSDITMAGTANKPYAGTFDGQNHVLTVNWDAGSVNNIAPFGRVNGATIKNLRTEGSIRSDGYYLSGLIDEAYGGSNTVANCVSAVNITSSYTSNRCGAGGLISYIYSGANVAITDCLVKGSIDATTEKGQKGMGGFVYSQNGTCTLTRCLYAGTNNADNSNNNCYTFAPTNTSGATTTLNNCYYLNTCGKAQGEPVTKAQLESGEVAYLLQNKRDDQVWGQELGKDTIPQPTAEVAKQVYEVKFTLNNEVKAMRYANRGGHVSLPTVQELLGADYAPNITYALSFEGGFSASSTVTGNTTVVANVVFKDISIATKDDWKKFGELVRSGEGKLNARLTADIDLGGDFLKIGSESTGYSGTFDGQGHTITIDWNGNGGGYIALFPFVTDATIKNLRVTGQMTSDSEPLGVFAFEAGGNTTFSGCVSDVKITNGDKNDTYCAAGMVRAAYSKGKITFNDCIVGGDINGTVDNSSQNMGGFVCGQADDATCTFNNCLYTGTNNSKGGYTFAPNPTLNNCYYLHPFANTQGERIVEKQLESGEVAYKLQGDRTDSCHWAQVLGEWPGLYRETDKAKPNYVYYNKENNGWTCDDFRLTDGQSLPIGLDFTAAKASYERTLAAGKATLCLPYDLPVQGFKAYTLADRQESRTAVHFKEVNGTLGAYRPYLLVADGTPQLGGENLQVKADRSSIVLSAGNYYFKGAVHDMVNWWLTSDHAYILQADGLFHKVTSNPSVTVPAYRAYISYNSHEGAKPLSIVFDGETTGIYGTTDGATDGAADGAVYNLQGQRVADRLDDSVRRQIPTGVYIVNGRKVIVK